MRNNETKADPLLTKNKRNEGLKVQHLRYPRCHKMSQTQETSMETEWMITGSQKLQKRGKQTPSEQLDDLQNSCSASGHSITGEQVH